MFRERIMSGVADVIFNPPRMKGAPTKYMQHSLTIGNVCHATQFYTSVN